MDHAAVSVYCRIRPLRTADADRGTMLISSDSKTVSLAHSGECYNFSFDRVFDSDASQQNMFDGVRVAECVFDVLGGYNATIFAYGQTASGKTHTMEGMDIFHPVTRGIIPRSATALFQACSQAPSDIEFAIKVSFVEIYMERIRDLIDPFGQKRTNLQIREDPSTGVYVAGCTEAFVTNECELLKCMTIGRKSRATAATGMNEGSSRSHSVLCITVLQRNTETDSKRVGKLVLVDLAGSEMVRKSQAAGQQLEEAKKINKSLSALGQVINALTDEKKVHVPYRDSKLTRMLQDSLGGNAKTALIVAASASAENSFETLSTLKFGQRAKAIKNKLHKAEAAIDMQSTYINALEMQVASSSKPGTSTPKLLGTCSHDAESMAVILALQQKIAALNEELAEERAESKRCSTETQDLTTLLHQKESLLLEAGELMKEVEAKMEENVRDRADLVAKNEMLIKAKVQNEERAHFRIRELGLRLEKANAVDARLRKEEADEAAISQGVSGGATTSVASHSFKKDAKGIPGTRSAYTDQQHFKLMTDLESQCKLAERLKKEMSEPSDRRTSAACRENQHMRSLQQRLEQLVAVHRQLLRKYAALELNLGEANKMIALRDERIVQLESQSEKRFEMITAQCHCMSTLMKDLDMRLLNQKSTLIEKALAGPRTLRGGQRDYPSRLSAHTKKTTVWWNR
mmetsp:Transcript_32272/g.97150  ORF Transcript_32272/g.97150 Transcript_32272/m.97150 type:complete len:689 (-) Transcript_32272:591-2657(-)